MLVQARINVIEAGKVTLKKFLILFTLAAIVGFTSTHFNIHDYLFPSQLVTIFSAAVGIFLAFRINAGYGRWWMARKIWGRLVVNSRSLGMYVTSLMSGSPSLSTDQEKKLHRDIIYGHIGYINAVRLQLRQQSPEDWQKELWGREINGKPLFNDEEIAKLKTKANKATQINLMLSKKIANYFSNKSDYRLVKLIEMLRAIYFDQGQSELIKNTVFAWGYAFYTRKLVWLLAVLVIFSQINSSNFMHMALVALISTAFVTIEQVGRNLDNPFENLFNDTPMSAVCRIIEIDLLQQLDEPCDLKPKAPERGILF